VIDPNCWESQSTCPLSPGAAARIRLLRVIRLWYTWYTSRWQNQPAVAAAAAGDQNDRSTDDWEGPVSLREHFSRIIGPHRMAISAAAEFLFCRVPRPAETRSLSTLYTVLRPPQGDRSAFRVVYTRPGRPGTSVNIARLCRALHERQHGTNRDRCRTFLERCNRSV
jgi:hypothetical protein